MADRVKEQLGPQQPGRFGVGVTPSALKVAAGAYVSAAVTTTASGATESVHLSASGLPGGAGATFQPASVQTGRTAKVTFQTSATTPPGDHLVIVTATGSAGESATATVTLTVEGDAPSGDVKVTVQPGRGHRQAGLLHHPVDHRHRRDGRPQAHRLGSALRHAGVPHPADHPAGRHQPHAAARGFPCHNDSAEVDRRERRRRGPLGHLHHTQA
ncbi:MULTISPECIES: PKD domain-containing protein [unclassified Nonomuraea]|uniref:COG1470 family protein n=1 Tax=unclassified Nonomuraea TaxID=2593643 RepID=UPI0033CE7471